LTVDNQPPTARLLTPLPGDEFTAGPDESLVIQAEADDNLSLARVVFYVDGIAVNTATVPPYSTRWTLAGAGPHNLHVRAFDAAGNFVDSERVTIVVK
jgi:hypothetical protein